MDSIGGTTGTVYPGTTYANGIVGQAFSFDGVTGCVMNTNTPSLTNIQNTFTIEFWAYPQKGFTPLQEGGGPNNGTSGQSYAVFPDWGGINSSGPAGVGVSVGTNGISVIEYCNNYMPSSLSYTNSINGWVHVAVVYSNKQPTLYVNGIEVRTGVTSLETFVYPSKDFGNSYGNAFGIYQFDTYGPYKGLLDEVSIYNRALSASEIAAIYNAGSGGKCPPPPTPPTIVTQPASQTNIVETTASFSVTAGGTQPLSYQWSFNTTNIIGATNATLTLANVQLTNAGNYSVTITNLYGSTNSATVVLTVNPQPSCTASPSGLVAWWPGEGNAYDVIGGNNGSLVGDLGYTNGEVGQAFAFNDTNAAVMIPASSSLDVGSGSGLTLEAWINPKDVTVDHPLFEWNNSSSWGVHFHIAPGQPFNVSPGSGELYANLVDIYGNNHQLSSSSGVVSPNVFQHVALTYDKASGVATIYCNGQIVSQQNLGSFTPLTSYNLYLGHRPIPNDTVNFAGLMDEPAVYNRALSSNEIVAIFNAGSSGKCPPTPTPPTIVTQPASQTNIVGTTASFSVTAGGTQPLSYQWSCNATNLAGATNATLTLANVQLTQTGSYSVAITNLYGSTNSAIAALTVVLPPMIVTQPQSQSVVSFQSAAFTVAATGARPLSYQWRKNGTNLNDGRNISGSITTNLNLAVVTLADAGNYDVVVSNPYATSNSVVAMLTVPQTVLTIGSTNGMSGSTLTVPVLMNALGVENAFIASVGYDTGKLALQGVQLGQATTGAYLQEVDSQTNNGSVGFAILLNSGVVVPAGMQEVARLVFTTLPVTNNVITSLTFGDSPNNRQLADNNGNPLPAIYQGGTISLRKR
jgi:hypothetical protein